jgi:hypothetical protein
LQMTCRCTRLPVRGLKILPIMFDAASAIVSKDFADFNCLPKLMSDAHL